jgi:curli production assembly/transport component CsgG
MLSGCLHNSLDENSMTNSMASDANVTDITRAGAILKKLPIPDQKIPVVVYEFQDQTGQFKDNGRYADYSSVVTKGGQAMLIKALGDSGEGKWFSIAERGSLKNLMQERQIINMTREKYSLPDGNKLPDLPPMLYGGLMLEGGIISYDSNVVTGGAGATYLGISASTQYHRDIVTVYIRAVNVQTGEVMLSVTSSKTIYSASIDTNLLKYVTYDKLFQAEAGFSLNEPAQLAVRQAIETAVYSLIMEGAINKMWGFKNSRTGKQAIADYIEMRDRKIILPKYSTKYKNLERVKK